MLKKLFLSLLLLLLLVIAGVYLAGGWLLGVGTRAALPRLVATLERTGLRLARCEFNQAAVRPPAHLSWEAWRVDLVPPSTAAKPTPDTLPVQVAALHLRFTDWAPLTADLAVEGIHLDTAFVPPAAADLPFAGDEYGVAIERIDAGFLTIAALAVDTDLRSTLAALATDLQSLARDGHTARNLSLGARLHFKLKNRPLAVRLESVRRDGATWLRFNASDIAELSRRYPRPLTAAEQQILCDHPQRALLLLRIKEYAERVALRLSRTERAYGEDFTRHVLWSYWLARTYGADFAQSVTDAHEIGTASNTAAEHRQDYANNTIGRTYALMKKSEGQVLQLIKTDPKIIRVAK
ncbi:MAG: hypothetical protein IPL39_24815 [Opitutaceae bacterium]|nr:hypothetical protein [Opitutaceae bacterium]